MPTSKAHRASHNIDHGLAAAPAARATASAMPTASKPCSWHARRATSRSTKRATCTERTRNALAALLPQALRVSAVCRRGAAPYGDANLLPKRAKMLVFNDSERYTIGSAELFYVESREKHVTSCIACIGPPLFGPLLGTIMHVGYITKSPPRGAVVYQIANWPLFQKKFNEEGAL